MPYLLTTVTSDYITSLYWSLDPLKCHKAKTPNFQINVKNFKYHFLRHLIGTQKLGFISVWFASWQNR